MTKIPAETLSLLAQPGMLGLLESVPGAAYTCDTQGLITYFNRRAVEVWGREPKVNDPVDRFCGSFRLFATDGKPIPHDQCWMALALRDGRSYEGQEIIVGREDGTRLTVLAHAHPILDEGGKITGAVNILVDITERKLALDASRRLAAIVESSDDAIVSKTLDGTIRTWNSAAERMFGWRAYEVVGRPITVIIPPDRLAEEHEVLTRIGRGETIQHYETVRQRKDGTLIDISLTVSPLRDRDGTIVGASKIARDVTEQKRLMALLRDADRQKDEFLAMLAHELRNPLAPISNAVQLLKLEDNDKATMERARMVIERQLQHMVRLVDDLMDVSRISRNKLTLRIERIDLVRAVQNAIEAVRPLVEASGQRFHVALPPEPVWLEADLTRLAQVFLNLLNNAVKYSDRDGRISIVAGIEEGRAFVRVRDNGVGIPPEMLGQIFDMFTQVDRTLERSQGGLGIGLSLVKRLVEMHGGTVEASSEGLGRGSEFIVRLPMLAKSTIEATSGNGSVGKPARTGGCRILVVDDNRDSAMTLSTMLKLRGNDVRTAQDGVEAIETAAEFRPEVVLLDIGLPRLNGYEAAKRIRKEPWGAEMFLIAVTGWGQDEDRRRSAEAGFNLHLVKPIDHAVLEGLLAGFDKNRNAGRIPPA